MGEERGSALLLVLLVSMIFTILGLAILNVSLHGTVQTEYRESDVQALQMAEKILEAATGKTISMTQIYNQKKLKSDVILQQLKNDLTSQGGQPSKLELWIEDTYKKELKRHTQLSAKEVDAIQFNIKNITHERFNSEESEEDRLYKHMMEASGENYLAVYELRTTVEVDGVERTLVQEILISTYPSFLRYALGTEGVLTINGGAYIQGDLYAGNRFQCSESYQANYRLEDQLAQKLDSVPPTVKGTLFLPPEQVDAYSLEQTIAYLDTLKQELSYDQQKAKVYVHDHQFNPVDVIPSFIDKLNEALGTDDYASGYEERDLQLIKYRLQETFKHASPQKVLTSMDEFYHLGWYGEKNPDFTRFEDEDELRAFRAAHEWQGLKRFTGNIYYNAPGENLYIYDHLNIPAGSWLIADGDVVIEPFAEFDGLEEVGFPLPPSKLEINGNMLINGDLTIRGQIEQFNSTVFVTGNVTIDEASIGGEKKLVLLTAGQLLLNRTNQFTTIDQKEALKLDAFLYTDNAAELYGVGSLFNIEGGVFAKEGLTINAVRGNTQRIGNEIRYLGENEVNPSYSRFQITYDPAVYTNHADTLPRVKAVEVIRGKRYVEYPTN